MTTLDPSFVDILRCPVCRGRLTADTERLTCRDCARRYPITDGIPALAPDMAEKEE